MSCHGQQKVHERLQMRTVEVINAIAQVEHAERGERADHTEHRGDLTCGPQECRPGLRSLLFQVIFVVQSAEHGSRADTMADGKLASTLKPRRAASIVEDDKLIEDRPQVLW